MVFHGAAMPFVLGPEHWRNAGLSGQMLHNRGGDFAGIVREAAHELKELKHNRKTEPGRPGGMVQKALLLR